MVMPRPGQPAYQTQMNQQAGRLPVDRRSRNPGAGQGNPIIPPGKLGQMGGSYNTGGLGADGRTAFGQLGIAGPMRQGTVTPKGGGHNLPGMPTQNQMGQFGSGQHGMGAAGSSLQLDDDGRPTGGNLIGSSGNPLHRGGKVENQSFTPGGGGVVNFDNQGQIDEYNAKLGNKYQQTFYGKPGPGGSPGGTNNEFRQVGMGSDGKPVFEPNTNQRPTFNTQISQPVSQPSVAELSQHWGGHALQARQQGGSSNARSGQLGQSRPIQRDPQAISLPISNSTGQQIGSQTLFNDEATQASRNRVAQQNMPAPSFASRARRSVSSPSNPNQGVHSQGVTSSAQNAANISNLLSQDWRGNQYTGGSSYGNRPFTGVDPRLGGGSQSAPSIGGAGSDARSQYIPDLLQQAHDSAREANEGRYQQGIDGYRGLLDLLPKMNAENVQRLQDGYAGLGDSFNQNLQNTSQQVLGGMEGERERVIGNAARRQGALGQDYLSSLNQLNALHNIGRSPLLGGYQDRTQRNLLQREGDRDALNQGYSDRQNTGMELLRGLGSEARENINTKYDEAITKAKASNDQDLINRGLSNTTIRSSNQSGIQSRFNRDRDLALNDLDTALRNQLFGAFSNLSGDRLGAQERGADRFSNADERLTGQALNTLQDLNSQREALNQGMLQNSLSMLERGNQGQLSADTALTGQAMGALQNLGQYGLNAGLNLGQAGLDALERGQQSGLNTLQSAGRDLLGFIERRNDTYPDTGLISALASQYGAGGGGLGGGLAGAPIMAGGGYQIPPSLYGYGPGWNQWGGGFGGNPWNQMPGWASQLLNALGNQNQGGGGQGGGGGSTPAPAPAPAPQPPGGGVPLPPPTGGGTPSGPVQNPGGGGWTQPVDQGGNPVPADPSDPTNPNYNPWLDPNIGGMTPEQYEAFMLQQLAMGGGMGVANPSPIPGVAAPAPTGQPNGGSGPLAPFGGAQGPTNPFPVRR